MNPKLQSAQNIIRRAHLLNFVDIFRYFGNVISNPKTINWCTKYINEVTFAHSKFEPPLPFVAGYFECVYSISVFSHLSEQSNYAWIEELGRIVRSRGIVIITTKGDYFRNVLLAKEREIYASKGIGVCSKIKEGKKCTTFHNPKFLHNKLLAKFRILQNISQCMQFSKKDLWIATKQ